ncbi:MAG: DUF721 domain-containing protein [Dissulfurispiraceae bacterium]|jgi:hypothetical protein|nr:DUF721 domain-containing protein [Dissulfurispiraceae bacterium]
MKNVGSLLSGIFRQLGIEDRLKLAGLQDDWSSVFSGPLSSHTWPIEIKNSELLINVDSPAWLGELKYMKPEIEKKLQMYGIRTVRFRHGSVSRPNRSNNKKSGKQTEKFKKHTLTDDEIKWIDETTSGITDAELRDKIKKTITRSIERKVSR